MKKWIIASLLIAFAIVASAEEETIDCSGNNKSDNYVSYSQDI